jgi:hypothetical protein
VCGPNSASPVPQTIVVVKTGTKTKTTSWLARVAMAGVMPGGQWVALISVVFVVLLMLVVVVLID